MSQPLHLGAIHPVIRLMTIQAVRLQEPIAVPRLVRLNLIHLNLKGVPLKTMQLRVVHPEDRKDGDRLAVLLSNPLTARPMALGRRSDRHLDFPPKVEAGSLQVRTDGSAQKGPLQSVLRRKRQEQDNRAPSVLALARDVHQTAPMLISHGQIVQAPVPQKEIGLKRVVADGPLAVT